jgi:hypothetical protein
MEHCWNSELVLDSKMWCGRAKSSSANAVPSPVLLPFCLLTGRSCLGLSTGEPGRQLESGVRGSPLGRGSSCEALLLGSSLLNGTAWSGDSDVRTGDEGLALEAPAPAMHCCSSMIFWRYFPCASIRSCSCLCTWTGYLSAKITQ